MIPTLDNSSPIDALEAAAEAARLRVGGTDQDVLLAAIHIFDKEACPHHGPSHEDYATVCAWLYTLAVAIERKVKDGH